MQHDPNAPADRHIIFESDDFDDALRQAGIEPDSVTVYEWSKFTDAFLAGTKWSEVAEHAADVLQVRRDEG